jgi:hypothetical protein
MALEKGGTRESRGAKYTGVGVEKRGARGRPEWTKLPVAGKRPAPPAIFTCPDCDIAHTSIKADLPRVKI